MRASSAASLAWSASPTGCRRARARARGSGMDGPSGRSASWAGVDRFPKWTGSLRFTLRTMWLPMGRQDPTYERKLEDFGRRVLEQPGALDLATRQAAARGAALPDPLAAYVDTVRRHAYEVTDADVTGLLDAGYSQDQVFELTVAAAYGAARTRLDLGRAAMAGGATDEAEPVERGRA